MRMKRILIVSDNTETTNQLRDALCASYEIVSPDDAPLVNPDLILLVETDDDTTFLHQKEKIGFCNCSVPVLLLLIEDNCFRIITWNELRKANYQCFHKNADDLIAYINNTLSNIPEQNLADIQSGISKSRQSVHQNGAFQVSYDDFASIYQFVEKMAERSGQCVQTLLLTLVPQNEALKDPEKLMYARNVLLDTIHQTLRKNDVLTGCNNTQILVLLMDTDDDGGHLATQRILNAFLGSYDDDAYTLHYDIKPIINCI